MTLSYRRLNDGLPTSGGEALRRFPSDPRSARAWVAALPRANGQATQMELSDALDSLAGQQLKSTQRLWVLEELRPAVLESIDLLKRQFVGSPLPLPGLKARAAQHAETFQLDMAAAYRKAAAEICAPEGKIPMLRGAAVTKALLRSAWHYRHAAEFAWRLYRAPSAGVWQGLHRVYRFAAERRLEARQIDDVGANQSQTVQSLYLQALLMSVAHPLAYSQTEQDTLRKLAKEFAGLCSLQSSAQNALAACVPEDADQGLGQRIEEESDPLWLDLAAYKIEVDDALARVRDGYAEIIPGRSPGIRVAEDLLLRLQRAFGMAAARTHSRRFAGHTLQTVFGLSALHYYLSGRRDFETFIRQVTSHEHHYHDRASWAVSGPEAAKVASYPAKVLDQSLGGYRMSWDQAQQIRARVGELIGVNFAEDGGDPDWMLGIVRWLRYEPNNALMAGVDLLSRRTIAIGLRMGDGLTVAPGKPALRAVALEAMTAGEAMTYLVAGESPATPARVEIVRDDDNLSLDYLPDESFIVVMSALNMGDYSLLKPACQEPAAEPQRLQEPLDTPQHEPLVELVDAASDEPAGEVVEHYLGEVFVEAYAETDEPIESLSLFADSYEIIEPMSDGEKTLNERADFDGDDRR